MKKRPAPALEASATRPTIRPSFHQSHTPEPCAWLDPKQPDMTVLAIRQAVKANQHACAGSYLFIADLDPATGRHPVFVVSELRSVAKEWTKARFCWLVAFYAARRSNGKLFNDDGTPFLQASVAGITEDVEAHLVDLARPKP